MVLATPSGPSASFRAVACTSIEIQRPPDKLVLRRSFGAALSVRVFVALIVLNGFRRAISNELSTVSVEKHVEMRRQTHDGPPRCRAAHKNGLTYESGLCILAHRWFLAKRATYGLPNRSRRWYSAVGFVQMQLAQALTKLANAKFKSSLAHIGKPPRLSTHKGTYSNRATAFAQYAGPTSTESLSDVQRRLFRPHRQLRERMYLRILAGLFPLRGVVEQHVDRT
jgi:hypothetical protein